MGGEMFWSDLSIRKKLGLVFGGAVIFFVGAILAMAMISEDLTKHAERSILNTRYTAVMTAREVDHLNWTNKLGQYIESQGNAPLNIQMDASKCAFGVWFSGDGRTELEQLVPAIQAQFNEIAEPHRRLHNSARTIKEMVENARLYDAKAFFDKESREDSARVVNLLNTVRNQVAEAAEAERAQYERMVELAQVLTIGAIALAVLGSLMAGILLTRAMSGPLRQIAKVGSRIMEGDLAARIDLRRKDEMGMIASSLNQVMDKLCVTLKTADDSAQEARHKSEEAHKALRESEAKEQHISALLTTMNETSRQAADIAEALDHDAALLAASAEQVCAGSPCSRTGFPRSR